MSGLILSLMNTLEQQIVHFDELIAYSGEKKDYITGNKTDELSALTVKENAATGKVQRLDKVRNDLMKDIFNVTGRNNSENLTLTDLADIIEGQPEHERLKELIVTTREKLDNLKSLNEQNRILLENSLDYIDFTINAIRGSMMTEQAIYSPEGEELGIRQSFFDAKQ